MSDEGPDPAADGPAARRAVPPRRVVISSVTGEPIAWTDQDEAERGTFPRERRPVLPDRVAADAPEPGVDESNDSRIAGDVPPHWGRGR